MNITQNYKNAFTEVYTILDYVEDEDYAKIPSDILSVIEENRNMEYEYEMNDDVDIYSQPMLAETRAILFNFYRDYWATPEQKSKILKIQNEERLKADKEKSNKYNPNDIFRTEDSEKQKGIVKEKSLIDVKEDKLFDRVKRLIKKMFSKEK